MVPQLGHSIRSIRLSVVNDGYHGFSFGLSDTLSFLILTGWVDAIVDKGCNTTDPL